MTARRAIRALSCTTLGALVLLVSSCTASPESASTTSVATRSTAGNALVDTNGTITVAVSSLPTNFNPSSVAGDTPVTEMVMEQVLPQPFVTEPSFNQQTTSLLVSAEVQSVSPFTVVYVIDPAAVWSNGSAITASDFVYAWHEHLANSSGLAASGLIAGYRDIASVTGSNSGRTVTVVFKDPFSEWQDLFSDLVPASVGRRYGWAKGFSGFSAGRILSGGPFEVTGYKPGRFVELSRNPRYWGTPARVRHIRFVEVSSPKTELTDLERGRVSIGTFDLTSYEPASLGDGLVASTLSPASKLPSSRRSLMRRLAWSGYPGIDLWQLCFNLAHPLTSKLDLREGIEHSLDRSEIVADSEDLVDAHIHAALGRLTLPGEGSNPQSPGTSAIVEHAPPLYEPGVAAGEFRAAGYTVGEGGVLRRAGTGAPLAVTLLEPRGEWAPDEAGLVIQAELRQAGVTVQLVKMPLSEMLGQALPAGHYELALAPFLVSTSVSSMAPEYSDPVGAGATLSVPPGTGVPWDTFGPLDTEPGAVAAGAVTRDVFGYSNSGVIGDLMAALTDLHPPMSAADVEKAESQMWSTVVSIPLFPTALAVVRSVLVDNVSESPTWAGITWNAEDWAVGKRHSARKG